ncbi:MAG: bile acid:sodium symporter family protein [Bacteroidales bacterium]|jgi:BASS family bile acid:Na+ symporter|nr:bile acid:sodium symporter family protein [Bacteroidales bacterium]
MSPLHVLDEVRLNFSPGSLLAMNVILAFVMFGIALRINFSDFREIVRKPKSFMVGVLSQFFLLPGVTFLFVWMLRPWLSPSVAMGMILVAACPGGNISNFITTLAKGNISLSVSMSAFSTLGCVLMTPFNFSFWGNLYSNTSKLVMPIEINFWEMAQTVLILLGIPIMLGILFARKYPKITQKLVRPMGILSIVVFIGFVVMALAANSSYFIRYIHLIGLLVIAHNGLALLIGYCAGRITKLSWKDVRSVTIETGIQNSGLGLVLIFNPKLFDGLGGMAFIAAWWGIWHIISGMGLAFCWQKKIPATETKSAE